MAAAVYDISIEQGATFNLTATLKNSSNVVLDLTGWSFTGQIRSNYSSETVLATFDCTLNSPATDGVVNITISDVDTAAIPVLDATSYNRKITRYVYDIEATKPDGTVVRLFQGEVDVSPEVTR